MPEESTKEVGRMSALLLTNINNATIDLGIWDGDALVGTWSAATRAAMTADEACLLVSSLLTLDPAGRAALEGVSDGVLASVVPALTEAWVEALSRLCGRRPLVVGPGVKTGLRMRYNDPGELGADRVANLVAAVEAYGGPLVVLSAGTTTNLEVIDGQGAFLGGIIAPGLRLSAHALSQGAARLAEVDLRLPQGVIGKNTREAMQIGVVLGEAARLEGLLAAVWEQLGRETAVVATGPDAAIIAALSRRAVRVDETLTLRGLALIHARNRKA